MSEKNTPRARDLTQPVDVFGQAILDNGHDMWTASVRPGCVEWGCTKCDCRIVWSHEIGWSGSALFTMCPYPGHTVTEHQQHQEERNEQTDCH